MPKIHINANMTRRIAGKILIGAEMCILDKISRLNRENPTRNGKFYV